MKDAGDGPNNIIFVCTTVYRGYKGGCYLQCRSVTCTSNYLLFFKIQLNISFMEQLSPHVGCGKSPGKHLQLSV